MVKAIIFDCFGVLVTDALQGICNELRVRDPVAADRIRDLIGLSNRGLIDPEKSSAEVADILGVSHEEYRQQIRDGEVKNYELLEFIKGLRFTYKTALLSNIGKGSLLKRFPGNELDRYFDIVVASGEVGYAKPEPQIYEITADRLGVRFDECLFTDDREEYLQGARSVGMQTVLYTNFDKFCSDLERRLEASPSSL